VDLGTPKRGRKHKKLISREPEMMTSCNSQCPVFPLVLTYKLFVRAARDTTFWLPILISKGGTLWFVILRASAPISKGGTL